MKKVIRLAVCSLVAGLIMALVACDPISKAYFKEVSAYSFWSNKGNESIAQYQAYNIIDDFLKGGKLENGSVIDDSGKTRKVAFIGWDGTRADALTNIMHDDNSFSTNGYNNKAEYSALNTLKNSGGVYMAFAGGEDKASIQSTSTCAGWTSELTGAWGVKHNVKENTDIKNDEYDTIMLKWAKLGLNASFAFDWGQLLDHNWKGEVKYKMDNPSLPMVYCDVDRKVVANEDELRVQENLKPNADFYADSVEQYNAVANDKAFENAPYDSMMKDYMLDRMTMGDDIVAGIFHNPDSNGHTTGFTNDNSDYVNSVRNADNYSYALMEEISRREAAYNEDWLIIITTDHGGYGRGHGKQYLEARTIWLASNKPIDTKYYSKSYDGYKI